MKKNVDAYVFQDKNEECHKIGDCMSHSDNRKIYLALTRRPHTKTEIKMISRVMKAIEDINFYDMPFGTNVRGKCISNNLETCGYAARNGKTVCISISFPQNAEEEKEYIED